MNTNLIWEPKILKNLVDGFLIFSKIYLFIISFVNSTLWYFVLAYVAFYAFHKYIEQLKYQPSFHFSSVQCPVPLPNLRTFFLHMWWPGKLAIFITRRRQSSQLPNRKWFHWHYPLPFDSTNRPTSQFLILLQKLSVSCRPIFACVVHIFFRGQRLSHRTRTQNMCTLFRPLRHSGQGFWAPNALLLPPGWAR